MFFNWNNWNWNTQAILFTLHFSFLYEASERLAQFAHHPCASSWLFVFGCSVRHRGLPLHAGCIGFKFSEHCPYASFCHVCHTMFA